jgi:NitT/TauT family transport system substrate-binding protein
MILKGNPEMSQDLLDQARAKMRDRGIVLSGDAKTAGIGAMTDARWAQFFAMASSQLPNDYPKTLDYKSAYTLQFLPTGVK